MRKLRPRVATHLALSFLVALAERSDRRKNQTSEEDGYNDAYDIGSSVSTSTMASLRDFDAVEPELVEDDPWEHALEALYEKR